jgi:hypothetical protein
MQIISAKIVRGIAQPGVEVEFRGEGGESVSIHLKQDALVYLTDNEIIAQAKEKLADVVAAEQSNASTGQVI